MKPLRYMLSYDDEPSGGSGGEPAKEGPKEPQSLEEALNATHAARRREKELSEKYSSLEGEATTLKERLEALEAEKAEREQAEMTELEKIQSELQNKSKTMTTLEAENKSLKDFQSKMEERELMLVEKSMEGLSDAEKEKVNSLPLLERRDWINLLLDKKPKKTPAGEFPKGGPVSDDDERTKYRNMTPAQRQAYWQQGGAK